MDISIMFEVYKTKDLPIDIKCKFIEKLYRAINNNLGGNYMEEIAYFLIEQLDPDYPLLKKDWFKKLAGETKNETE